MTFIDELVLTAAEAGLKKQAPNGAMPEGCNGPHAHQMTPARNTGHWAILFLQAFILTNQEKFRYAANQALSLLVSRELRPISGAFWHRSHPGKNSYNGLVGQAWSLESLCYGWKVLGDYQWRDIALEVFEQHVFSEDIGLWKQLDLDGSPGVVESTFNQQIWMAAIGATLAREKPDTILPKIEAFLTELPRNAHFRPDGLLPASVHFRSERWGRLRPIIRALIEDKRRRREVEYGYHIFSMTGFATLYLQLPDHPFWRRREFKSALEYCFNDIFLHRMKESVFGFPYNVPGFELPFIYGIFQDLISTNCAWDRVLACFRQQIQLHYDSENGLLILNTKDSETLAARMYELYRIPTNIREKLSCMAKEADLK